MLHFITRNRLTALERWGSGSYGEMFQASWNAVDVSPRNVNIKALKQAEDVWSDVEKLVKFQHPNLLRFWGISQPTSESDIPWIVLEGASDSSLWYYVYNNSMTTEEMVQFAYQVAAGMKYLHHTLNPLVVHGDLSAKSVLVFQGTYGTTLKLANFANCDEEEDPGHYYDPCSCVMNEDNDDDECQCPYPYPLRWMPKENLPEGGEEAAFNRKGDVWSYGILLFEIWNRGRIPFEELNDFEVITALQGGETPRDHDNVHANQTVYGLMDDCWEQDPEDRTNFIRIMNTLQQNYGQVLEGFLN